MRPLRALRTACFLSAPALAQGPPPAPVRTDAARMEEVAELASVSGEVRAAQRALVAGEEPGLVLELLAREGQAVEAGAVLARLDAERLRLEREVVAADEARARAAVEERGAEVARAAGDLDAVRGLAERGAGSAKELADAEAAHAAASARVRIAEHEAAAAVARGALLDRRVADCEPRAPFAGVVVARHTEAGQWLGAGAPIVELVSTARLEAWLDVPQRHFDALSTEFGPIEVTVDAGGREISAAEWRSVPWIDSRGRRFQVVAPLPAGADLAPGMSVTARVPTGARAAHLTVSRDAVLRGETGAYVFAARAAGPGAPPIAELVPVEVLFPAGARVAIRSHGLEPGTEVVVEGNERLYPGAPLAPGQSSER